MASAAHGALDEALPIVRTGGVDALAAPVGQAPGAGAADQVRQPAGEVAAHHVAVARVGGPAGQERHGEVVLGQKTATARGLLVVQQAKVVLAALAQHRAAGPFLGLGEQPAQLAVDLPLQVAGIGRDPDGGAVALRPETGRRDVAQSLADPGAGLSQNDVRLPFDLPRFEGGGQGAGVVGLLRPRLRVLAEQLAEPPARFLRVDGLGARRVFVAGIAPLGEAAPNVQAGAGQGGRLGLVPEEGEQKGCPKPAAACQGGQQGERLPVAGGGAFAQQQAGGLAQRCRLLGQGHRLRQSQCFGQSAGRRRAKGGRAHEGIELQKVEPGQVFPVQPPAHARQVAEQGWRLPRQALGLTGGQLTPFGAPGVPVRRRLPRDQHGRVGNLTGLGRRGRHAA